jgi:iron complex outermembrane receptor protein
LENTLRYGFGNRGIFKQLYVSVTGIWVAHQRRVPANSDYLVPPSSYMLLNSAIGFSLPANEHLIHVSLSATNLFNISYRDYMDRFRYFTDEPGRNFIARVRIPFGSLQHHIDNN